MFRQLLIYSLLWISVLSIGSLIWFSVLNVHVRMDIVNGEEIYTKVSMKRGGEGAGYVVTSIGLRSAVFELDQECVERPNSAPPVLMALMETKWEAEDWRTMVSVGQIRVQDRVKALDVTDQLLGQLRQCVLP